jgi:ribosomal protein S18 acetylase RimI-like enzyme
MPKASPIIRYAQSQPEAKEAQALFQNAPWAAKRSLSGIRRMLERTDLCFVARQQGRLVGMARVVGDMTYRAVLHDVIVDPKCQRMGIGKALVSLALQHPRLKKVEQIWLYTTDKQAFYQKLGFGRYPENIMILKRGDKA